MKLHELFADDDAVSPVIGVILMVAITVILAAVIGTFVLGLGGQVQDTAPNAQFTFNENSNESLMITNDGGQSVDINNMNVTGDGTTDIVNCQNSSDWGGADELSAGDSCTVPDGQLDSDETVRIVWESDEGGTSSTLADYEY
jgi:flagellin-like protein